MEAPNVMVGPWGATKIDNIFFSFLRSGSSRRQIETRVLPTDICRAFSSTVGDQRERPPFNTAHMNGDDGGMTLGKALSKHYTTNTTWYSYRQQALKFIMSTQPAFSRCRRWGGRPVEAGKYYTPILHTFPFFLGPEAP